MDSGEAADNGVEMTSKVPVAPAGGAAAAPAGDGARVSPFPHLAAVRSQLRPWHVRFSLQMQALVEKNLIIAKRHWKVTVLQVLSPVFFVLLTWIAMLAIRDAGATVPAPYLWMGSSSGAPVTKESDGRIMDCRVFDRVDGGRGWGQPIPEAWCTSLAYAPAGNAELDKVMTTVAERAGWTRGLHTDPTAPLEGSSHQVVGFENSGELEQYLLRFPGRVGHAVFFHIDYTAGNASTLNVPGSAIRYHIEFNSTVNNNWWMSPFDRATWGEARQSGATRVQRAVDEAIIAARVPAADAAGATLNYSFTKFPAYEDEAEVPVDQFFMAGMLPLVLFCSMMVNHVVCLIAIVSERENHLLEAMRSAGLFEGGYWLSYVLHYSALSLLSAILTYLTGLATDMNFFANSDAMVIIVMLFLYSMSMSCLAFMLAALIPRTKIANAVSFASFGLGFLLNLVNSVGGGFLTFIFVDPTLFSQASINALELYPPIAFAKVFADINEQTLTVPQFNFTQGKTIVAPAEGYQWGTLFNGSYMFKNYSALGETNTNFTLPPTSDALGWMFWSCLIFTALAWYIGNVLPGDSGRSVPPWFFLDPRTYGVQIGAARETTIATDLGSATVRARHLVKRFGGLSPQLCLSGRWDEMTLGKPFTAVKDFDADMEPGQIFALLGHNGAGKTTAIRMITGVINTSGGDAFVGGHSVTHSVGDVRQLLGVCPQHDQLWDDLTPVEHLRIFAKFRGVEPTHVAGGIDEALDCLKLADVRAKPVGKFSGGMRRRVSVAISAISGSRVVCLDEPTTGMDPLNRRHVWDMIQAIKHDRMVLLTTHSMEEADALGDEIAIMAKGEIIARGSSLALKDKYGSGYRLTLVTPSANAERVKDQVSAMVPGSRLTDDSAGALAYDIGGDCLREVPELFKWLESLPGTPDEGLVTDWSLSGTTLEDVFLRLGREGAGANLLTAASPSSRELTLRRNLSNPDMSAAAGATKGAAQPVPTGAASATGPAAQAQPGAGAAAAAASGAAVQVKPAANGAAAPAGAGTAATPATHSGEAAAVGATAPWDIPPGADPAAHGQTHAGQGAPWRAQMRGVARRNARLFRLQKKAICCQICCPSLLLFLMWILQVAVIDNLIADQASDRSAEKVQLTKDCSACVTNWETACNTTTAAECPGKSVSVYPQCEVAYCPRQARVETYQREVCSVCAELYNRFTDDILHENIYWRHGDAGFGLGLAAFYAGADQRAGSFAPSVWVSTDSDAAALKAALGDFKGAIVAAGSPPTLTYTDNLRRVTNATYEAALLANASTLGSGVLGRVNPDMYEWLPQFIPQVPTVAPPPEPEGEERDPKQPEEFELSAGFTFNGRRLRGGADDGAAAVADASASRRGSGGRALDAARHWAAGKTQQQARARDSGAAYDHTLLSMFGPSGASAKRYAGQQSYGAGARDGRFDDFDEALVSTDAASEAGVVGTASFPPRRVLQQAAPGNPDYRVVASPRFVHVGTHADAANAILDNQVTARRTPPADAGTAARTAVVRRLYELFPLAEIHVQKLDPAKGVAQVAFHGWPNQPQQAGYGFAFLGQRMTAAEITLAQRAAAARDEEWKGETVKSLFPQVTYWSGTRSFQSGFDDNTNVMNSLHVAMLRSIPGGDPAVDIEIGLRGFPEQRQDPVFDFDSILMAVAAFLMPFATSYLLPMFLFTIVQDKELRLRATMLAMGLNLRVYWIVMWLFNLTVHVAMHLVFYLVGVILSIRFFTRSSFVLIMGLFICWGVASVGLTTLVSSLFSRTKTANVTAFVVISLGVLVATSAAPAIWPSGEKTPAPWMLYAPFAFYRGIWALADGVKDTATIAGDDQLLDCMWWLLLDGVLYMVAWLYLDRVFPQEFGVQRHPLFCLEEIKRAALKETERAVVHASVPEGVDLIDDDVANEYRAVAARHPEHAGAGGASADITRTESSGEYPIDILNLRKVYGGTKVAVDNFSLGIKANEIFALLGPNGAGKTTAISVLTGLYKATDGGARIMGFDVATQMDNVHQVIGVCPQFDVFHPGMTVRDHLLFYARIKGMPIEKERAQVEGALNAIGLGGAWADKDAGTLSGGMKRRLTLGISFIGNPSVVFLDEPTTGLDPETRRAVWRLIERARNGRTIVLTTHAMDEADALAKRIGIMANGKLQCLGTSLHLKRKFGSGFKVEVDYDALRADTDRVREFVLSVVPEANLKEDYMGKMTFVVDRTKLVVSALFEAMTTRPDDLGITAWALRQSSLEEVFLRIAMEAEAAGTADALGAEAART